MQQETQLQEQATELVFDSQFLHAAAAEHWRRHLENTGDPMPLVDVLWPRATFDDFQVDIITSMMNLGIRDLYIKGCTGCGKSSSVAVGACLWFYRFRPAKVIITSVTSTHAQSVIFGEITRWFKSMTVHPGGKPLQKSVKVDEEHFMEVVNPATDEGFSGRHGRYVLFIFDEGTGVPDARYKMADTQATKFVSLANPRTLSGRFRLAFKPAKDEDASETFLGPYGHRRVITVGGLDCRNVREFKLEMPVAPIGGIKIGNTVYQHGEQIPPHHYKHVEPVIPGQICYDTFLGHCANPDPRWVEVFAHGKFLKEDPQLQVILDSWLDRHIGAWLAAQDTTGIPIEMFGLDVARSKKGDESVLAGGGPAGCAWFECVKRDDTQKLIAWCIAVVRKNFGIDLCLGEHPVVVDADGVGGPVADAMRARGIRVIEFRGGVTASDPRRHRNQRAEAYDVLGKRLDPNGTHAHTPWPIPPDSLLRQDLCAPEKIYDADGFSFKLTPKHREAGMPDNQPTLTEKLGRSPDRGDAVVYLYWGVHSKQGTSMPLTPAKLAEIRNQRGKDKKGGRQLCANLQCQRQVSEGARWCCQSCMWSDCDYVVIRTDNEPALQVSISKVGAHFYQSPDGAPGFWRHNGDLVVGFWGNYDDVLSAIVRDGSGEFVARLPSTRDQVKHSEDCDLACQIG